jgi:hypothetical protein
LLPASLSRSTAPSHVTPFRPQTRHPERSEGVAKSRTSSQQNLIGPPSGDCPWSV